MQFLILLALSATSIAGAAAYFSIYGLAQIFSGAFWPVVIMGSVLEAGKLVSASYLYNYWKDISFLMKTYLISAIIVLMMITSAGIFGFLTAAHQKGMQSFAEVDTKVTLLIQQKTQDETLKQERLKRREQIDGEVANLPSNSVRGRQKLSDQYSTERGTLEQDIARYTKDIEDKTTEINTLKLSEVQEQAHIGPILYVAKALGKSVDDAVIWMTYLIMFAFDPLAVCLTIGFNIAIALRKTRKQVEPSPVQLRQFEPSPIVDVPASDHEPSPSITSVDDLQEDEADWEEEVHDEPVTIVEEDLMTVTPPPSFAGSDIAVGQPAIAKRTSSHPPNIRRILKLHNKNK